MAQPLTYRGPAGTFYPSIGQKVTGVRSNSADPLYKWRRYYSKRGVRPVNVLCIGDSILYGQGAAVGSPPNFNNWSRTMPALLQQHLNGEVGAFAGTTSEQSPEGAYGPGKASNGYHVRSHLAIGGVPSPWQVVSGSLTQMDRGHGGASTRLNAGTRISFTAASASAIYFFYEDGASNVGTPNFSIYAGDYATTRTGQYIDNYAVTMNTGLAQYTRSNLAVALPSRGKYTFEVGISTGTPVIDGMYVFDHDLRKGVRVYNWALSGTSAFTYSANNTQANTAAASFAVLPDPNIDLVIVYLGAADYSPQDGTSTPAMFTTNLQTIIDKYRTAIGKTVPFLLVSHFARYDITPSTYAWSLFEAAMRTAAASRTDCDHLMLSPYFPISQAADTDEDLVDSSGVHFTEGGQSIAAQVIAQKLTTPYVLT